MITYDIHVFFGAEDEGERAVVKCHDTGINFRIYPEIVTRISQWRYSTRPYAIPYGSTAILKVAKPDRTFVITDGTIESGSIYFETKPQSFTAQGKAEAEISIYGEDGRRITSASFIILITKEAADDCSEESESYVDILAEQIAAINAAKKSATDAATHPPIVGTNHNWWTWDPDSGDYIDSGIAIEPETQIDYSQNDNTQPDYVKNRPCYEDVSINITWDGDTTDRIAASDSDYLVSFDTPSSEDLIGASYTSYNYGERTFVLTADSITYPVENLICVSGVVFIALEDNLTYEEKTFPVKGTYFHKTSLYRSISLYKGTLKKLDPKFIDTDSLPKELLKVTVLYDASTGYSADKTYLDISNCLENGGIPYIALYKGVSTSGLSEILTYCGLSGQGYVFINADSGNGLIIKNNNLVLLVSSDLKSELDKTVKTESQTLSESQKSQARANIGAAETAFGITGASVGQIIKIKAVDDSGVPTGWEVCNSETWTFTLDDGSTVTKEVYVR